MQRNFLPSLVHCGMTPIFKASTPPRNDFLHKKFAIALKSHSKPCLGCRGRLLLVLPLERIDRKDAYPGTNSCRSHGPSFKGEALLNLSRVTSSINCLFSGVSSALKMLGSILLFTNQGGGLHVLRRPLTNWTLVSTLNE